MLAFPAYGKESVIGIAMPGEKTDVQPDKQHDVIGDASHAEHVDHLRKSVEGVKRVKEIQKNKQSELSSVERQIEILGKLRDIDEHVADLRQSEATATQHIESLHGEIDALKTCSDSLSKKKPAQQNLILRNLRGKAETTAGIKSSIDEASERVASEMKDLTRVSDAIFEFERRHPDNRKKVNDSIEESWQETSSLCRDLNLEATGYRFTVPVRDVRIENIHECIEAIKDLESIRVKMAKRQEEYSRMYGESDAALRETVYYRDGIILARNLRVCRDYHQELEQMETSPAFFQEASSDKFLQHKVQDQIASLSTHLEELKSKAGVEDDWCQRTSAQLEHGSYAQAIDQCRSLLDLYKVVDQAMELQKVGEVPQGFVEARDTALATLHQSKDDITESFRAFFKARSLSGDHMKAVVDIYKCGIKLRDVEGKKHEVFVSLGQRIQSYEERGKTSFSQQEMQDYFDKGQKFIDTRMSNAAYASQDLIQAKAAIDYYYGCARKPLLDRITANNVNIVSIEDDLKQTQGQIIEQEQQGAVLTSEFYQLSGDVPAGASLPPEQIPTELERLQQRRSTLQQEIHDLSQQAHPSQSEQGLGQLLKRATIGASDVADRDRVTEENKESLQKSEIEHYTDLLSDAYRNTYGEELDRKLAKASVDFLHKSQISEQKMEKYIHVANHLIHEFGTSLNNLCLNRKTYEIHVMPRRSKQFGRNIRNLEELRINRNGVVLIGNKKLKVGVLATVGETSACVLSVRAKEAFGESLFAADTVMPQSGAVDFEDLAQLSASGNRNVAHIVVQREFKEEAQGYELIPETLKEWKWPVKEKSEHVVMFRAQAKQLDEAQATRVDDAPHMQETTGVFLLDVARLLENHRLGLRNFFDESERLDVMRSILAEAHTQGKIATLPQAGEKRWQQYVSSYNVNHLIEFIREVRTTLAKGKVAWT